jgi:ELWxxDGT repeat protein
MAGWCGGAQAGTLRVTDLNPGSASATPLKSFSLLALEDHGLLLFAASDGVHGVEPWVTDGTEAGTSLVADLNSGASSSLAGGFRRFGAHVFFSADDGVHGQEPWSLALEPLPVTPEEPKTGCGGLPVHGRSRHAGPLGPGDDARQAGATPPDRAYSR